MLYLFRDTLRGERPRDVIRRSSIVGIISFLTLIDLFGSQALLPRLITAFDTDASVMGFAVNAATFGMAISGLLVAWFANRINRKRGIWISLALLSIPTALLGVVTSVELFLALRVAQGFFMAAAFTLTITYLSEQCDVTAAGGAMAAFITGNVASNLFGRLLAVGAADGLGLSGSFYAFACLNLLGALLALLLIGPKDAPPTEDTPPKSSPASAWKQHLSHPALVATFAIGFVILFVFVGVFTYVNLHLTANLGIDQALLGLVYFIFLPAMITTPMAAKAVSRYGPKRVFQLAGVTTLAGTGMTVVASVPIVLAGLAVIGMGTFFMQAAATGFVGRTAKGDRASANGLYLTSYYVGGLSGAFFLGQAFTAGDWPLVAGIVAAALALTLLLARALSSPGPEVLPRRLMEQQSVEGSVH